MCFDCKVFKTNMDDTAMSKTLNIVNRQFKEFGKAVAGRDRELENISMELAIGLSEAFEALKKIASGDPEVKIAEKSEIELISRLKHVINVTARSIGEIVDQSHEVAIGLAEHFDILHRVSKGDLNAKVSGISQIELLGSLKKVTNEMIDSISMKIIEHKKAEEKVTHLKMLEK